jgi:hypothetical protein
LAVSPASVVGAQTHPIEARGFAADKTYQAGDVDAINLFNGNLTLTIPIGIAYPLREGFGYQFTLVYNSIVWDFEELYDPAFPELEGHTQAFPNRGANAGLGWSVGFGRLLEPGHLENSTVDPQRWVYLSPDGAEHIFYSTLHEGVDDGSSSRYYTRDGTYLRLKSDATRPTIEFPDGTKHTFHRASTLFEKMEDMFGNAMWMTVVSSTHWRVEDTHGRQHHVWFEEPPVPGPTVGPQLSEIELDWIGSPRAHWTFGYDKRAIYRPAKDNHSETPTTVDVALLRTIDGPEGLLYAVEDLNGPGVAPEPYDGYDSNATTGCIRSLRTPTGALYSWEWQNWTIPPGNKAQRTAKPNPGVSERTIYDSYQGKTATWSYSSTASDSQGNLCGSGTHYAQKITTVEQPDGSSTRHYFITSGLGSNCSPNWEYGLPYSSNTTLDGMALSSEILDPGRVRSTWVAYARDALGSGSELSDKTNTNRRVTKQRTKFDDDGADRYVDTTFDTTTYDGVGHYRKKTTFGRFGGAVADQWTRLEETNFNPGAGATWSPATGSPWILGTFTYQQQTEGTTARQNYSFEAATGFLLEKRMLESGTATSGKDVRIVFTKSTTAGQLGQVKSEQWFLGDATTGGYRIEHGYASSVRKSSKFVEPGNLSTVLTTLDLDLDSSTGLATAARDAAGYQTSYSYDQLGRVTRAQPVGPTAQRLAWSQFTYTFSDNTSGDSVANGRPSVLAQSCAVSDATSCVALAERKWHFDDRGHPTIEMVRHPTIGSAEWPHRSWEYDNLGRVVRAFEWSATGTDRKTHYQDFDTYGRPRKITLPDGKVVDLEYSGVRQVKRTVRVATDLLGNEGTIDTVESYDAFGRLVEVQDAATTTS